MRPPKPSQVKQRPIITKQRGVAEIRLTPSGAAVFPLPRSSPDRDARRFADVQLPGEMIKRMLVSEALTSSDAQGKSPPEKETLRLPELVDLLKLLMADERSAKQ